MAEEVELEPIPRGNFVTYMAEGEQLYQKAEFKKAIECFNNALIIQPNEKNGLVFRARCFLKLGNAEAALMDAEASLKEDKDFFRGLYEKAEALYAMGDFEFALVFYHRGNKVRPELQQFRLGIQKAKEAILNSVGSPATIFLENTGDIMFISKQQEDKKALQKVVQITIPKKDQKKDFRQLQLEKEELERKEKKVRQLLGELYTDKEFLETLLKDKDLVKDNMRGGIKLKDLIKNGITYLDSRTSFWRQQKPLYARDRDRKLMEDKWNKDRKIMPADPTRYILRNLQDIDKLLTSGHPGESKRRARQVLKTVQGWSEYDVPNKQELIGNLYSCIGNAQLEMGDMQAALESQKRDLDIANQYNLPESKSRALDNIGRIYARIGQFNNAINAWEEKIPMVKSNLERTWLFHEIGRCYLELSKATEARDYGEKSMEAAEEAEDIEWQLNASVLVAQAEVQLKDFKSATTNFEKALERTRLIHNEAAEHAIKNALEEVKKAVAERSKSEQDSDRAKSYPPDSSPDEDDDDEETHENATKDTEEPEEQHEEHEEQNAEPQEPTEQAEEQA